jgi:hypothetical protein
MIVILYLVDPDIGSAQIAQVITTTTSDYCFSIFHHKDNENIVSLVQYLAFIVI